MGKKKAVKKAKELSVAITESSSKTEQKAPRKRGRPKKIIENNEEIKEEKTAKEVQEFEGDKQKKLEEITEKLEGSSANFKKEEEKSGDKELEEQQPLRRTRRKSKPRKSS